LQSYNECFSSSDNPCLRAFFVLPHSRWHQPPIVWIVQIRVSIPCLIIEVCVALFPQLHVYPGHPRLIIVSELKFSDLSTYQGWSPCWCMVGFGVALLLPDCCQHTPFWIVHSRIDLGHLLFLKPVVYLIIKVHSFQALIIWEYHYPNVDILCWLRHSHYLLLMLTPCPPASSTLSFHPSLLLAVPVCPPAFVSILPYLVAVLL
jgi:hypothetical protein